MEGGNDAHLSVKGLNADYLVNPLGIDSRAPCLGWKIDSPDRGVVQAAYQVQAARTLEQLAAGRDLLWDSAKVQSDESVSVRYGGPAPRSCERVFWRVRTWDGNGRFSGWSEPAWWETGLLLEADWTAEWVEPGWDENPARFNPCPFLRRSFIVGNAVKSARLYVTSHGLYEAWLNGGRVGDQVFTPGYTPYDRMLQYQVYDVSPLVRAGENALGAILGDGWYRGKVYVSASRNVYGTRLGLLAQLRVETVDGEELIIGTDSLWKAARGPLVKSDMKDGETYDARLEMPGWCNPVYDDGAWHPVRVVDASKKVLVASMGVPVRRKEIIDATAVFTTPKGETVVDFGQNIAGVVRFRVSGPRGTTLRLRHGETLDKDGNFTVAHLYMTEPRPGKEPVFQEVLYTLKGGGVEEHEPLFTVHGFRYVKVEGWPGTPRAGDFQAVAIYSDMPSTGSFTCSEPLLNQLHRNTLWSMKGNFLDLPTDCPTRERAGWTGDAQIFTPSASFLMDTRAFFAKWLKELGLEQRPNGKVGNFVPNPYRLVKGGMASFMRMIDGSSGWGDVAVIMPWALYQAFGDRRILETQYAGMKAFVEWERACARRVKWYRKANPRFWLDASYRARQRHVWDTGYHWGEWLEPGTGTSTLAFLSDTLTRVLFGVPAVATAYFVNSARTLSQAAEVLGRADDARTYRALSERAREAYQKDLIGADGAMKPDRQASYARVLAFDLAAPEQKPAVRENLVRLVRASGNHIGTGFLSTPFLCRVLAENGRLDVAYDLLMQKTIPSWLYAVSRGATTIWESWEGIREDGTPQLSLNHYSPGSIVDFLHSCVAGINPAEPGYRKILIRPQPGGGLTSASGAYESVRGMIRSEWAIANGRMRLTVAVPANATATIRLPGAVVDSVMEGGVPAARATGVSSVALDGKDTIVEAGSGVYSLEYPMH